MPDPQTRTPGHAPPSPPPDPASPAMTFASLPRRDSAPSPFWRWAPLLPLPAVPPLTLGEGGTPLLPSARWPGRVWWKDETRNPTGSQKDRPLALAAAHARAGGARLLAAFSAGSVGLSAAAYAARAGLPCAILMSEGVPEARVAPLAALGARLLEVPADIDAGIAALSRFAGRGGIAVASTTRAANPVQAEAGRTLAFEILEDLGRAPDRVVVPAGGGGTLAALHDGFAQLCAMGLADRLPQIVAVVPHRFDLLARALAAGALTESALDALPPPPGGPTILNKIAHLRPPDAVHALRALHESGGRVLAVSDDAALSAVSELGASEGLYLEPSSAVAWRALETLEAEGALASGVTVALACGSGFRETHVLLAGGPIARERVELDALGDRLLALAEGT